MKRKLSIFGLLFAIILIEFPVQGFAGNVGVRPAAVEMNEGTTGVATSQPRRRRRRRAWRNGRLVWVWYTPSRRYRIARRYYYVGGVRRVRSVRVYY